MIDRLDKQNRSCYDSKQCAGAEKNNLTSCIYSKNCNNNWLNLYLKEWHDLALISTGRPKLFKSLQPLYLMLLLPTSVCTKGNWTFRPFVSSPPGRFAPRRFTLWRFLLIQLKPKHHCHSVTVCICHAELKSYSLTYLLSTGRNKRPVGELTKGRNVHKSYKMCTKWVSYEHCVLFTSCITMMNKLLFLQICTKNIPGAGRQFISMMNLSMHENQNLITAMVE